MSDLNELARNREALLLVEVAAWLHDMGKCTDEHIINQSSDKPKNYSYDYKKDYSHLLDSAPNLSLLGESIPIKELVKKARPGIIKNSNEKWILRTLGRCHGAAHIEKEEAEREGKQRQQETRLSSVFGFERAPLSGLSNRLSCLRLSNLTNRNDLMPAIKSAFSNAAGETQRSENEVTLWDWSSLVAALYKSAIAGALIGFNPDPADLNWRLLSIRLNGLSFFTESSRLPDLLIRLKLLRQMLDEIQQILEIDYLLGTEVYRDENGSLFVVPGCNKNKCDLDLLSLQDGGKKLFDLIREKCMSAVQGEIVPQINIDSQPWWGQDPDYMIKKRNGIKPNDELPPILDHLQKAISFPEPEWTENQWSIYDPEEICNVCGLRPQGPSKKAKDRDVCDVCEQRRADRSRDWATEKFSTTIWTDEVADTSARLALLVGNFDPDQWLRGDLVRTLTVCDPANAQNKIADVVSKNPSFARLRRIWETTRGFWQDVCPTDEDGDLKNSCAGKAVGFSGPRLAIKGKLRQKGGFENPGPYHAYDLVLPNGIKPSVAWDPEEGKSEKSKGRLISNDNLVYLTSVARVKSPSKEENETESDYSSRLHKWAAETVKELILREKNLGPLPIEESTGYGGKAKEWGEIDVETVEIIPDSKYTSAIPILAEPRTFMALVPADRSLDVVQAIKSKYEREMGKVRNRLPLHLGIVYAHRRTPLRAILDAGRRMLEQRAKPEGWKVICPARKHVERSDPLPERFSVNKDGQFKEWLEILLERDGRRVNWFIPTVMGDGETIDHWYPYVFLDSSTEPVDRDRRFKAPNPWTGSDGWLVHAADLKTDDIVFFTPATLDFQWLDSAGRRFEISYDEQGHRRNMPRRPYMLDELETLDEIWTTLKSHLTKNQIYILRDLVEAKREEWHVKIPSLAKDDVFWRFCRDALANAEWKKGKLPWEALDKDREIWFDQWADYATLGWLADVVELHLQIMKEDV